MDGTGIETGLTNWTTNMDGTAGGTTPFAWGVPDATSPLQMVALFILFFFPAVALVVVSLRAAGRWAWGQFGWGESLFFPYSSRGAFANSCRRRPDSRGDDLVRHRDSRKLQM